MKSVERGNKVLLVRINAIKGKNRLTKVDDATRFNSLPGLYEFTFAKGNALNPGQATPRTILEGPLADFINLLFVGVSGRSGY